MQALSRKGESLQLEASRHLEAYYFSDQNAALLCSVYVYSLVSSSFTHYFATAAKCLKSCTNCPGLLESNKSCFWNLRIRLWWCPALVLAPYTEFDRLGNPSLGFPFWGDIKKSYREEKWSRYKTKCPIIRINIIFVMILFIFRFY